MSRLIPIAERMERARALIQKARDLPPPDDSGWQDFSYIAQVKDLLQKARDFVKFVAYSASASDEVKAEAAQIMKDTVSAEKEILHKENR